MQKFILTASLMYGINAFIISILMAKGLYPRPRHPLAGVADMVLYIAMMVWGVVLVGKA